MSVLPLLPPMSTGVQAILNAAVLIAVLTPLLVMFLVRPLRAHNAQREREAAAMAKTEQRFQDIADNADEWIWEVDQTGRYTYSSGAVERILGYTSEEVLELHFYDLFHPEDRDQLRVAALEVFESRQSFRGFLNRNVHKSGKSVWLSTSGVPILDADGSLLGYRGADTVKFDEVALTDPLTGLVNRRGFKLLAEQQIRAAIRNKMPVAILFADLDNLKQINDRFGHTEGDQGLVDIAAIFKRSVRDADIVSRFGGDEFVVFLAGATETAVENVVIHSINRELDAFNQSGRRRFQLSFSYGVAWMDLDQPETLEELIRRADASMYEQKQKHRPHSATSDPGDL